MTEEIIISGFGGQGVLSMGKILAYAGIMEGELTTSSLMMTVTLAVPPRCSGP